MTKIIPLLLLVVFAAAVNGFGAPLGHLGSETKADRCGRACFLGLPDQPMNLLVAAAVAATLSLNSPPAQAAVTDGASSSANAKITTGGASTLQSGRTIAITRGVNLDNSDFSGQNLKGVAFQQSIVRDTNFKGKEA